VSDGCGRLPRERGDVSYVGVRLLRSSLSPSSGRPDGRPDNGAVIAALTVRELGEDLAVAFGQRT
jgi:hypothetical protein